MLPPSAYIAIALVIGGGGGAWWIQSIRSDLAECKSQSIVLAAQIIEQNNAIEAVRSAGQQAQAQADAAIATATSAALAAEARVARRKAIPAPASCDAAFDQLDAEK